MLVGSSEMLDAVVAEEVEEGVELLKVLLCDVLVWWDALLWIVLGR